MKAITGLLVDMDGTLVDTAEANFEAYHAALAEFGVSVSRATFDRVTQGTSWRLFLPKLLSEHPNVDAEQVAWRKAAIYAGKVRETRLNHAVVGLIDLCRPICRTALVTTASSPNVRAILAHHGLDDLFDTIVTGSDVTNPKPHPEPYAVAAARLQLSPDDCLILEDSDVGVASATAFGARCLKVVFPA